MAVLCGAFEMIVAVAVAAAVLGVAINVVVETDGMIACKSWDEMSPPLPSVPKLPPEKALRFGGRIICNPAPEFAAGVERVVVVDGATPPAAVIIVLMVLASATSSCCSDCSSARNDCWVVTVALTACAEAKNGMTSEMRADAAIAAATLENVCI